VIVGSPSVQETNMGMTITEKILARASGKKQVSLGEVVTAEVDLILDKYERHGLWAYEVVGKLGLEKIDHPERIIMLDTGIYDSATEDCCRWARKLGVPESQIHRNEGVFHHVLLERGYVVPGMVFIGTDSHTPINGVMGAFATGLGSTDVGVAMATGETWLKVPETIKIEVEGKFPDLVTAKDLMLWIAKEKGLSYALGKSAEFAGPTVEQMGMDGRITMCDLSLDIGQALTGLIEPDETTLDFLKGRTEKKFVVVRNDPDAEFSEIYKVSVAELKPMVACPHNQANSKPAREVTGVKINQAIVGTCTNGRFDDLKLAADVVRGKKVHSNVRFLVTPASTEVYRKAWKEGLIDTFFEAGAVVSHPGCQPCIGHHGAQQMAGDVTISSGNRNHRGRLGCHDADIYLGSPATVAASAVAGEIIDPRDLT